jgi:hypothetical protein
VTRRLCGVLAVGGCLLAALPASGLAKGVSSCDARADDETLVANRGVRIVQRQETLVANREVRIFQRQEYYDGALGSTSTYACNRKTGRLRYFQDAERGKDSGSTRRPTAAGPFVAYIALTDQPTGTIFVWNSRTGATRVFSAINVSEFRADGSVPRVTSLVLTPSGGAAWIVGPTDAQGTYAVHTTDHATRSTTSVVASGTDIAPRSLAVADGVLYWTQGSTACSALFP